MKRVFTILLYLFLSLGSIAITLASLVYFNFDQLAPFVLEKFPIPSIDTFLLALRIHVAAAALALPGCLLLSSSFVLKRYPKFHRYSGRLIGPSHFVRFVSFRFLSRFFARGGRWGTLGFIVSGVIVFGAMILAIKTARAKQYGQHRRFTLHVLGQLGVAVISRAMLYVWEPYTTHPDLVYDLSLWIPVVAAFGSVEWMYFSKTKYSLSLQRRGLGRGQSGYTLIPIKTSLPLPPL